MNAWNKNMTCTVLSLCNYIFLIPFQLFLYMCLSQDWTHGCKLKNAQVVKRWHVITKRGRFKSLAPTSTSVRGSQRFEPCYGHTPLVHWDTWMALTYWTIWIQVWYQKRWGNYVMSSRTTSFWPTAQVQCLTLNYWTIWIQVWYQKRWGNYVTSSRTTSFWPTAQVQCLTLTYWTFWIQVWYQKRWGNYVTSSRTTSFWPTAQVQCLTYCAFKHLSGIGH